MPADPVRVPAAFVQAAAPTAAALLALLVLDRTGYDLLLAAPFANAHGFPLKDDWLLDVLPRDGGKALAWTFGLFLWIAAFRPLGPWVRLPRARRIQLALTPLLAWAAVALLKLALVAHCPWDLRQFGGFEQDASHWGTLVQGHVVHCFPAGRATTGFCFVGGWFAWRHAAPPIARRWLLAALALGLAFGLSQQLRGAHFMSHTLWSGWICWAVAWLLDPLFARAGAPEAPRR